MAWALVWLGPIPALRTGLAVGLGVATVGLALGLWRAVAGVVPVAVLLVGAGFAVVLARHEVVLTAAAPLFGGGLLLAAELADWSLELRRPAHEPGPVHRRHLAWLLAVAGLGVGLGVVLTLATAVRAAGTVAAALGVAGLVGGLGLVALLAGTGRVPRGPDLPRPARRRW